MCTITVYTTVVKNITLSADQQLIEAARAKARASNRTLNDEFRDWLAEYVARNDIADRAVHVMEHVAQYAATNGRRFTRDEMNDR